jgi:hypothetical protein
MSHTSHLEYSKKTTRSPGYFLFHFRHVHCFEERWMICDLVYVTQTIGKPVQKQTMESCRSLMSFLALFCCGKIPTFQRSTLHPSSGWSAPWTPETMVSYHSTRRHNTEELASKINFNIIFHLLLDLSFPEDYQKETIFTSWFTVRATRLLHVKLFDLLNLIVFFKE